MTFLSFKHWLAVGQSVEGLDSDLLDFEKFAP